MLFVPVPMLNDMVMVNVISTVQTTEDVNGIPMYFQEVKQEAQTLHLPFNLTCRNLYDQLSVKLNRRATELELVVFSRCDNVHRVVKPTDAVSSLARYLSDRYFLLCFTVCVLVWCDA